MVAHPAMPKAIALSKSYGIGAVAIRNSGHFGTAMQFTQTASLAGRVGFISVNASPAMAVRRKRNPSGRTRGLGQCRQVAMHPWRRTLPTPPLRVASSVQPNNATTDLSPMMRLKGVA